jgi:hypothetical protein
MNKLSIALVLVGVFTVATAGAKPKKPTTCMTFKEDTLVVDGESQKVAICEDGKKPVVLTNYSIVTIKNDEGVATRAAIGYR